MQQTHRTHADTLRCTDASRFINMCTVIFLVKICIIVYQSTIKVKLWQMTTSFSCFSLPSFSDTPSPLLLILFTLSPSTSFLLLIGFSTSLYMHILHTVKPLFQVIYAQFQCRPLILNDVLLLQLSYRVEFYFLFLSRFFHHLFNKCAMFDFIWVHMSFMNINVLFISFLHVSVPTPKYTDEHSVYTCTHTHTHIYTRIYITEIIYKHTY